MGVEQTMTVPTLRGIHSEVLAGDAAVSGGVLPAAVSGNEDADFAQRVQEQRCGTPKRCGSIGHGVVIVGK